MYLHLSPLNSITLFIIIPSLLAAIYYIRHKESRHRVANAFLCFILSMCLLPIGWAFAGYMILRAKKTAALPAAEPKEL